MALTNLAYKTHYTRGADLVAASTLPLILDGDYFHVSGSTTITALQSIGRGMQVVLRFTEACTIQHTDDQLVLPDSQDINAEDGDLFRFLEYDTGKWILAGSNSYSSNGGSGEFTSSASKSGLSARINPNSEFTTDLEDWTKTGGWDWDASYGGSAYFDAVAGSGTLSQNIEATEGHHYYGEIKLSGVTSGYVTITIGSYSIPSGPNSLQFDTDGTYYGGVWAAVTGNVPVTITPSAGANPFSGYIEYVRFYEVDTTAVPALTLLDDADANAIEVFGDATLDNTWIGLNSGQYCYNGENNTCLGYDAGSSIITGHRNTFIGKDTGEDCTMGSYNTAVGDSACESLTTGSSNTFIGQAAGQGMETGYANTFIGKGAGEDATGSNNTFVGFESGKSNTTGTDNLAIGYSALSANLTQDYNIAIGRDALLNLTDNGDNVVIGWKAAAQTTDLLRSVIIGNQTCYSGSLDAYGLVVIGHRSGEGITTGDDNTIVGREACRNLTTGSRNVVIGKQAANATADASTFVYGNNCVIIGTLAKPSTGSATNEIVIGYEAEGNGSNTATIGNSSNTHVYLTGEMVSDSADINGNTDISGTLEVDGVTTLNQNLNLVGERAITIDGDTIQLLGASGNITMDGVLSLGGGQIEFPGTQNPAGGSNVLDDYEEGTFTPAITIGGSTTGITYEYQHGRYTKIGDMVTFQLDFGLTDKGTFTNSDKVLITGLPFTNASTSYSNLAIRHDDVWCDPNMVAYITNSAATITPGWSTTTTSGFSQLQYDSLADDSQFHISGHYYV